jgi:hypothetical protein
MQERTRDILTKATVIFLTGMAIAGISYFLPSNNSSNSTGGNRLLPDLTFIFHSNPYGIEGVATRIYRADLDLIGYSCPITNFGTYRWQEDTSLQAEFIEARIFNITTGAGSIQYPKGKYSLSNVLVPGFSDPSTGDVDIMDIHHYDEYDNYLSTKIYGDYAVKLEIDTRHVYKELDYKNNVTYFGFHFTPDAVTYDSSLVTPSVVRSLNQLKP